MALCDTPAVAAGERADHDQGVIPHENGLVACDSFVLGRHDLTRPGADPQRFFDLDLPDFAAQKYWMPSAWDKKTAAAGIDVDARGNVLLGDLVNHEVVEIAPDGKKLSVTKVPWPDRVVVSRKTGSLYVISRKVSRGYLQPGELIKITGRGEAGRPVAHLPLRGSLGGACTLDESGPTPVLWLAGSGALTRVEDRGDELAVTGSEFLNRDPSAITFLAYVDVDPEAELIYVTGSRPAMKRTMPTSTRWGRC